MNTNKKVELALDVNKSSFDIDMKKFNSLPEETEDDRKSYDGSRTVTRLDGKTHIVKPIMDYPTNEKSTKVATEGIYQELRDIKLLLIEHLTKQ